MVDRIKVALIDGQPLFRQGFANVLTGSNLVLVATGGTVEDARRAAQKCKPDILLLDIMGVGIGAVRDVLRLRPTMKVVVLTDSNAEEDVVDALRSGVRGYILKDISGPDLVRAIEAVHRGEPYVTPAFASRLLMQNGGKLLLPDKTDDLDLTPRDKQILAYLGLGFTNQEIAQSLGVKISTLSHHLTQVFCKLRVSNRVQAILKTQKLGLEVDGQKPSRLYSSKVLPQPGHNGAADKP